MQLKFSDRLESRFYDETNNVLWCFRKLTGRKRMKYEQEVHTIAIFSNELKNVHNLNFRLTDLEIKNVEFENMCLELLKSLQREIEKLLIIRKSFHICKPWKALPRRKVFLQQ